MSDRPGLAKGRFVSAPSVQYGEEFRDIRENVLKWYQTDAAKHFNCTVRTIRNWETGEVLPPVDAMDWMRAQRRGTGT